MAYLCHDRLLTCHTAIQELCRAPDQALVVLCNGAARHSPIHVVKAVFRAWILHTHEPG